jgi:predicted aldo/keto reductase-like oxidoreductase
MKRRDFIRNTASAMAAMSLAGITTGFKMNGMPYRILGKTGLKVSLLGVGGHHIGNDRITDETSLAVIRGAIDRGINFLDNAWHYNDGRSEELMGKALKDGYRKKVYLMTKHHGRDPKTAQEHLETSLRRLQTDYIDVWQFHEIMTLDEVEQIHSSGVLDFALKMKEQGRIGHIGFTGHAHPEVHKAMLEKGFDWETVQMPINVLDHHYLSFSQEIIPLLQERNIGIIGMKSAASGRIIRNDIATIQECLRFTMSLPVSTLISGMEKMEYMEENVSIANNFTPMDEETMTALLEKTYEHAQGGVHEWYKKTTY